MFILNKKYQTSSYSGGTTTFKIKSKPLVVINKAPIPAKDYIKSEEYEKIIKHITDWTVSIVGHTRMATQGTPTDNRNNHPFQYGTILGVHNGIISNWREVQERFKLDIKGNCDSEVIFALIQHFMKKESTLVEAIKETCKEVRGSLSCAVADIAKPEELVLFRRGNPLSIRTVDKPFSVVFFASRDDFITKAFENANKKNKGLKIMDWKRITIEDNAGAVFDTTDGALNWLENAITFELP